MFEPFLFFLYSFPVSNWHSIFEANDILANQYILFLTMLFLVGCN